MKLLNRTAAKANQYPTKVIQFGEGNFLRAFVDWIIWNTNQKTNFNAGVVVVQPIERGMVDMLNAQDSLYHVNLQGLTTDEEGESVKSYLRPELLCFRNCENVLLEDCLFQNSPCWNIHPLMCRNLIIKNINVRNPWYATNGDGLDIDS